MAQIIFNTYELIRELGSGGGGIVYLAKHQRLGKYVVLKADKRTLKAKPEALRREVDALKNLNHTYIPQVYDFFVENDTVYTVVDYIEGESLDKPLKRGERFEQADVIKWADELLQALVYLHSRPPHGILHGDIKPANIMLTPQGDICLIDFNIALALGEEGAVRVGLSRGYASPEHYGIDYTNAGATQFVPDMSTYLPETRTETVLPAQNTPSPVRSDQSGSYSSSKKAVLLDVRSDIYSLGATLYHLLTGVRPDHEAKNVIPISSFSVSPAVAEIVGRAMAPNPDERYQTAQEMLDALRSIHSRDPRSVKHRRRVKITAAVLASLFIVGGITSFAGLRGMQKDEKAARLLEEEARRAEEAARIEAERAEAEERRQRELEAAARAALADVTSSEDAYRMGNIPNAVRLALDALAYESPYEVRAQKALTDALGVYDMSDGFKARLCVELPAEPGKLAMSPGGAYCAVVSEGKVSVYSMDDGSVVTELDADRSALADAVFAGENTLLYAGNGALTAYDLQNGAELWRAAPATNISLGGGAVAAVYRDETTAYVYDAATGETLHTVNLPGPVQDIPSNDIFTDPENDLFALDDSAGLLAVSVKGGGLQVLDLSDPDNNAILYENTEFTHFEGGFFGKYLAFSATGGGKSVFAVIDTQELRQTGGFSSTSPFHVQADADGIFLSLEDVLVGLDPESGEQTEIAYTETDITAFCKSGDHTIVATDDGTFSIFGPGARRMGTWTGGAARVCIAGDTAAAAGIDETYVRVLKFETKSAADLFRYDPEYAHSEARLSADGETVTLFRYDKMRVCGLDGSVIADVEFPDAENVYDQQFRRNGDESHLEVTWYDGTVRNYSAKDGSLIGEEAIPPPDTSLYVEYVTEKFRVEAPLNGSPAVYNLSTGEKVGELQSDDYLTYISDCAGYTMAEFMTGDGERYGLLLTDTLEPLAELPNLCDVFPDGTLIFDDYLGTLRRSRVYTLQELKALTNQKEDYHE